MPFETALSIFLQAKLNASCALTLSPVATATSNDLIAVLSEEENELFSSLLLLLVISRFFCCLMFAH